MKFGPVPLSQANGAVLAHAVVLVDGRLAKGTRLDAADVERLAAAGIAEVIAAVLDAGDLSEDDAASAIGRALLVPGIRAGQAGTGRVNLFAEAAGLLLPDKAVVDQLNAIDPGITLATLGPYASVAAGGMIATVKIIPLAVPGAAASQALALLGAAPAFRLAPFSAHRVALVQTELPGLKRSVLDKTRRVLEQRLSASSSTIVSERRCQHRTEALREAIASVGNEADLLVVFGASAVIDAEDVIPAAIAAAGGTVLHLGMPVDPGNLLLLGDLAGVPVLGAPGCARSPKENGFDWVLNRLLASLAVMAEDIRGMGVGGLLMEIATRPQPREHVGPAVVPAMTLVPIPKAPVVDIVILAAGRSSRMGGPSKLLATFDGVPLVRRSAMTALESGARRVRVVVGHRSREIAAALEGLAVETIENADYGEGLSTSLVVGIDAAASDAAPPDGVLVMLADQPLLTPRHLASLIAAFAVKGPRQIVVACENGRHANPVVLPLDLLHEIRALKGDVGAKSILAAHREIIQEVEIGAAAGIDVDTPEALAAAGGVVRV